MKAVYFKEHGDIENIRFNDLPEPIVGLNELLVETKYVGLNHLDLFVLKGWPGLTLNFPHIMGSDGVGFIKDIGENVSGFKKGDPVVLNPGISCGICKYCLNGKQNFCQSFRIKGENMAGTFAELFSAPAVNFLKVPSNFDLKLAAAAPLNFLTAWRMLTTLGKVKLGDRVLIQGAGGGVATAAIQIAKLFGATVITTTSNPEKVKKAKSIGADYCYNYETTPDYAKRIYKEITNKEGVDIVIDSVGKETFSTSLRLLRSGGKYVTCGATTGGISEIDLRLIFWKQLQILGSTMGTQQDFRESMHQVFEGVVSPVIDSVYSLENAQNAQRYLQQGNQFGKILLKI